MDTPLENNACSAFSLGGSICDVVSRGATASDADAKIESSRGIPVDGGTETQTERLGGDVSRTELGGPPSFARRVERVDGG